MEAPDERTKLIKTILPDLDECEIDIIKQLNEWEKEGKIKQNIYNLDLALKHSMSKLRKRLIMGRKKWGTLLKRDYIDGKDSYHTRKETIYTLNLKGEFVAFIITNDGRFVNRFKEYGIDNKKIYLVLLIVFCHYIKECYSKDYLSKMNSKQLMTFIRNHLYDGVIYYLRHIMIHFNNEGKIKDIFRSSYPLFPALQEAGLDDEEIKILKGHLVEIDFLSQSKFEISCYDKMLKLESNTGQLNTINEVICLGCLLIGFEGEIDVHQFYKDYLEYEERPLEEIKIKNVRIHRIRMSTFCPDWEKCKPKDYKEIFNCPRNKIFKKQ